MGKFDGYGQYMWAEGAIYDGDFKNGLKHGRGKWRKNRAEVNCNAYEGQYYMDKKQGVGTFVWSSGNQYRGEYHNDDREGFGEMKWTDGSIYIG
jgi:hypothetical protein